MAFSPQVYGVVSQVVDDVDHDQTPYRKKANTVVVAIGSAITGLISILTYLIESGVTWLPDWAPLAVMILGLVGTIFGVSKTKNAVTPSIKEAINARIADLIDSQQGDGGATGIPEPAAPTTIPTTSSVSGGGVRDVAEQLDALAKKLAQRG